MRSSIPFLLIFLMTAPGISSAQRFFSVVFDQLPKDMQMYARDDDNKARIPVSGIIEVPDWSHMSAVTYRNGNRYSYVKSALNYGGKNSADFEMEIAIEAEPADYTIEIWACKQSDSAKIVTRNDIVGGDFYLISGQSNGAAIQFGTWSSKYCRTIARIPDNNPAITPADTLWIPSAWSHLYTGAWGLHLQRLILENHNIPTTIINGSIPGTKISQFVIRNNSNPGDPNNLYGSLIHRMNIARPKRIRGFFWYQGEQEAIENIPGYESHFEQLYQYWMQDYPMVEKFYIIQTNIIFSPISPQIRDYQRRIKYLFPKTDHFSTLGVPLSPDRVHYLLEGYQELARRLFYFLEPQYYGSDPDPEVRSPDIKKVFYPTSEKNEMVLVFDEGQQMEWPADSIVRGKDGEDLLISNRDFFFFDGNASKKAPITQGKAEGNRVTITFSAAVDAQKLTYLPIDEPENLDVLQGPYLRNSRKLGIFSFANVSIADPLAIPVLTAAEAAGGVSLSWQASPGASAYVIEKKSAAEGSFSLLTEITGTSFTDAGVVEGTSYIYRVYAVSEFSESPYSEAEIVFSPILGIEPSLTTSIRLFPNPVKDKLKLLFDQSQSGKITVTNALGVPLIIRDVLSEAEVTLPVSNLSAGLYFVAFENGVGGKAIRKFVK